MPVTTLTYNLPEESEEYKNVEYADCMRCVIDRIIGLLQYVADDDLGKYGSYRASLQTFSLKLLSVIDKIVEEELEYKHPEFFGDTQGSNWLADCLIVDDVIVNDSEELDGNDITSIDTMD